MWRSGLCSTKRYGPVPMCSEIGFVPAASTTSLVYIIADGSDSAYSSDPEGCLRPSTTV
jgi:hypothetical protein